MSDKEKQILKTFEKVIPELSELEKEKLLSFGEGMAFKSQELKKKDKPDGKESGDSEDRRCLYGVSKTSNEINRINGDGIPGGNASERI